MATCLVQLDDFHGQYYPGDEITGKIICSFMKPTNIRGVKVILLGKEHTEWQGQVRTSEHSTNKDQYRTVKLTGDNKVLEVVNTLRGECSHPEGRQEYPFSFKLPRNLPGTFQCSRGWIKYTVKGKIVIPFGFDHEDVKEIKVVSQMDLSETPGVDMSPSTYTAEKSVSWFFKPCGLITMKMHLEKNGFVRGEVARALLELTNLSTESVSKVEVKMLSVIESHVTYPEGDSKIDKEVLATFSDTGVGAHGQRNYSFGLKVPASTALTNFNICRLFKHSAKIEVTAHLSAFHSNLELTVPVYIGPAFFRNVDNTRSYTAQSSTVPNFMHTPTASQQYPQKGATSELPPPYSQVPQYSKPSPQLYPEIPAMGISDGNQFQPSAPPEPAAAKGVVEDDFILL